MIFWGRFWARPDFRGTPLGSPKSSLKIKKLKNGGRKVLGQTPYVLAYEKNLILASIWEGFGMDLGPYLSIA